MSWRDLVHSVDDACDALFGDPVTFTPWTPSEFGSGTADSARSVVNTVAIPVHYPENVTEPVSGGKSGPHIIEADERVSVQAALVGEIKQGDRVAYGGRTFEIVLRSSTMEGERVVFHLSRVK